MQKINSIEKFNLIDSYWDPRIITEFNDSFIKFTRLKGQCAWHVHDDKDELFYIIKGKIQVKLRTHDIQLEEGEFFIVPKGVEHYTIAEEDAFVMLIEPKSSLNDPIYTKIQN